MSKRKQTPMQEAHAITAWLIRDYMDAGQPHADYDPESDIHRPECVGGQRRADAIAKALTALSERCDRKASGGR